MRSDHLSKHIRTHTNQRHSAPVRSEIIGIVASASSAPNNSTVNVSGAQFLSRNVVVSSMSGAPMVITAPTSAVSGITNGVILQQATLPTMKVADALGVGGIRRI